MADMFVPDRRGRCLEKSHTVSTLREHMFVLGIDPGLSTLGYGLVEAQGHQLRATAAGVMRTEAGVPVGERLEELYRDLDQLLDDHRPDEAAMEQVFVNLLINARNAIEEKWEQGAHEGEAKKIYLKTSSKDGKVTIEVKDTGVGIPKSMLDKIFEPFTQGERVGKDS